MEKLNLTRYLIALLLAGMLALPGPGRAESENIYEVDQIMDMSALTPEDFYRFVPNYYWIEPGDIVRFNNTTGNHTVKTVNGIWPDGVETVDIANQAQSDIRLSTPGVYGFRCTVHGRHGMFALIVVGSPDSNFDQVHFSNLNERGKKVFGELFEKLEADRKNHQK